MKRSSGWRYAGESGNQSSWLERDLNADWTLAHRVVVKNGRPVIAETRIFPSRQRRNSKLAVLDFVDELAEDVPSGGMSARLLREIRTEEALRFLVSLPEAEAFSASAPIPTATTASFQGVDAPQGVHESTQIKSAIGRPELSDLYLARISNQYASFIATGETAPVQALRRWMAQEGVTVSTATVRSQLHKAEQRGFLKREKSRQGKATGVITTKSKQMLASIDHRRLNEVKNTKRQ